MPEATNMVIEIRFPSCAVALYILLLCKQVLKTKQQAPHEVSVCRGHMRSITCPNLQLLHIYNAFYGKLSGHDCESPVTQIHKQIPTCFSKDAPDIVRQSCQGQQSCDLYAEDGLYSNPCPSVQKYLFVSFSCQGKSRLPEILKMFQREQVQRRQMLYMRKIQLQKVQQQQTQRQLVQKLQAVPPQSLLQRKAVLYPSLLREKLRVQPVSDIKNQQIPWQRNKLISLKAGISPLQRSKHNIVPQPIANVGQRLNVGIHQMGVDSWHRTPQQRYISNQGSFASLMTKNSYKKCEKCDGNCLNFLCYGCGGCEVPPPSHQMYFYPFQREDAEYHDAFVGHQMDLSGLVLYPVPKYLKKHHTRSLTETELKKHGKNEDVSSEFSDTERLPYINKQGRKKRDIDYNDMYVTDLFLPQEELIYDDDL